jgi:hypothetical protein
MSSFAWSPAQLSKSKLSPIHDSEIKTAVLWSMALLFCSKFPVLPFDVDCFLPQSLYLSKDYKPSRYEYRRSKIGKAQSVYPSFSKLLKLYWTRADVSSLAWTQARILKNEAWRIHECVRTKVGQYKTSEAIQAILSWRLATYENDLFQNVPGEDE